MPLKSLQYFLFSKNKKPLYEDDNGLILEGDEDLKKPNGQPANLRNDPEGWKGTLIKYARNIMYWGMTRSYTAPMRFVKDGSKIISKLRWTLGVEAICYLGILKLDRTQLPYNYENFYLAELNFVKYKKTQRGVNIEALEGGLSKLLKAFENTVYEIPIDTDPEHINVLMDGMEFDFKRSYSIVTDQVLMAVPNYFLGMVETSREGNALDISFQDLFLTQDSGYPNDNHFNKCDKDQVLKVSGNITAFYNRSDAFELRVEVNDGVSAGSTQHVLVSMADTSRTAGVTEKFTFNETFTVPAGSRCHPKIFTASNSGSFEQVIIKGGDIDVDYVYRHRESYVKGLYPFRVMEKIVEKMTEGKYGVKSAWLSAMKDFVILSGDALRGIVTDNSDPDNPIKGAVIKTSILDFFKWCNRWGAGLGIDSIKVTVDDKLLIEPLAYFFKDEVIMDLGEVAKAEMAEAQDLLFNTIRCGYFEKSYSDANGRYEVNQGQQWTTPITREVKELDLRSPYRGDPFGAELLRINYDQKTTSDSTSDNETFFLNIETEAQLDTAADPDIVYYELYRPPYTAVSGLPHWESAFNTEVTPKKSLLSAGNGAMIRSVMNLMETDKLKLQSADKNTEFSTTLSGVTVLEKEDIQIGSLPAPLFRPNYISFTTKVPVNVMAILRTNPYGKVKFTVEGVTFYGFLMDGGVQVGLMDTQVWKVLSAPENDLSKFNNAA